MNSITTLMILVTIFAFGEIIADKTKAILSTTLVIAVVLLIAFWCGMPADIYETANLNGIAMTLVGLLITHLGTIMDFKELQRQWKTAIIGFGCVVFAVVVIVVTGPLLINREMAIAGAPIFAGANVAALVMTQALTEKGLAELSSFVILMLVTQNFVGIPIASILLRKEATSFLAQPALVREYCDQEDDGGGDGKKRKPLQLPALFDKSSVHLAKLAMVAALANFLASLTSGNIHYFIVALILGVIFSQLGFLEKNSLSRTASSGFIVFATTVIIFANLARTTPQQMFSMILPLILCLGIGVAATCIAGIVLGKALKVSPRLAISLGLTCTFGFPTTMLMPKEVANAIGSTPEEVQTIERYLLPKMVTAGFVTVTIVSVIVAGVVANIL